MHKQSLQSELSLFKGTNLSRSNQVAELAGAADNRRLFDHRYIIFSSPARLGFVWGQEMEGGGNDRSLLVLFLAAPLGRQDESYPNYKWKYPHWTNPSQGVRMATTQLYHRWISIECLWMRRYKDIVDFFFSMSSLHSSLSEMRRVEIVCQCNWGHIRKQTTPSFNLVTLVLITQGCWGRSEYLSPALRTPLPITALTGSKHIFFFMHGTGILNDGQVYRLCDLRSATEGTHGFTLQFRHKATPPPSAFSSTLMIAPPHPKTTLLINRARLYLTSSVLIRMSAISVSPCHMTWCDLREKAITPQCRLYECTQMMVKPYDSVWGKTGLKVQTCLYLNIKR